MVMADTMSCTGINLEFARLLLENGANVVLADLALRPEAEELVKKYQQKPKAVFQKTDVSSWAELNAMFQAAIDNFGAVDIVCPGAGVFEPHWSNFWYPPGSAKSIDDPLGDRYKHLDINLTHPIRTTQLAISHFLNAETPSSKANPKSIVHISSIAGETASLPFPIYHAAKHGVQALVRCLAPLQQLNGIRVTGVMPGIVKTPLFTEHPEKLKVVDETKDEWVTPEDVAKVMLALVKDDATSTVLGKGVGVEGEKINIQGGTILEVLSRSVRDVPMFGNVGPYAGQAPGGTASHSETIVDEVVGLLKSGWGKL